MANRALIIDLWRDDVSLTGVDQRRRDATILLGYGRNSPRLFEGDEVVVLDRLGDETSLAGRGQVAGVQRLTEGLDGFESRVMVIDLVKWEVPEHGLTLRQLAPSLRVVSNPFRPRESIRHRGWIDPETVGVVISGTLEPSRTAFFGLLAALEREWRDALVVAAVRLERIWRAESAFSDNGGNAGGVPLRALLYLLQIRVGTPVALGAAIFERHRRLFPRLRGPLRVSGPESESDAWDTDTFIERSFEEHEIRRALDALQRGLSNEVVGGSEWPDLAAESDVLADVLK